MISPTLVLTRDSVMQPARFTVSGMSSDREISLSLVMIFSPMVIHCT